MNRTRNFLRMMYGLYLAGFLFLVGCWWVASYFEARAYNRITGAHVSTFDAMFVELRVQNAPSQEKP